MRDPCVKSGAFSAHLKLGKNIRDIRGKKCITLIFPAYHFVKTLFVIPLSSLINQDKYLDVLFPSGNYKYLLLKGKTNASNKTTNQQWTGF